jgi:hypothetical protein
LGYMEECKPRHPAVQWDGEVQPCVHEYHRTITSQNTKQRIAEMQTLLKRLES